MRSKPTAVNHGTIPETSGRPNLGRHAAACKICSHPQREDIEQDFIDWRSAAKIAKDYGLRDRSSVYRHARALNLYPRRERNVKAALEFIIEQAGDVAANASAIVTAAQVYAKINGRGVLVERDERLELHDLFERMTPGEYEAYAKDGTLPAWFQEAIAATGGRVPKKDEDE